jgi:hypothetical protein
MQLVVKMGNSQLSKKYVQEQNCDCLTCVDSKISWNLQSKT